jgi:hypothetical protein
VWRDASSYGNYIVETVLLYSVQRMYAGEESIQEEEIYTKKKCPKPTASREKSVGLGPVAAREPQSHTRPPSRVAITRHRTATAAPTWTAARALQSDKHYECIRHQASSESHAGAHDGGASVDSRTCRASAAAAT